MKRFILVFFTLLLPMVLLASGKTGSQKVVPAYKINNLNISLDGKLTEPIWKNSPVSGFIQRDPEEGAPSTEKTEVWVAYDEGNLYVAAHLHDSKPELIDASLARRDGYTNSDWFGIYVDAFNDKRTGNYFGVNAGGTMVDGVLFNDSWDDETWDGIWEAKTYIDETGWSVELKIPFSQLRFNEVEKMTWGINFTREIKRNNEKSFFVMVPKSESGFVSRFASLEGLIGVKPKQRFEVLPYLVQKSQFLVHDQNDPFYKSNQFKTSLGADVKIGIGSNLNIDATINPDFGQVEVDPAVINLSAFESYFEEKRPFFIEGANMFYFGIGGVNNNWGFNFGWPELFYSRRIGRSPTGSTSSSDFINSPGETRILGAAKLTGKLDDHTTVGAVSAITERTFATLYNNGFQSKEEIEPLTHYGVFRAKREFGEGDQSLGLMFTTVNRNLNDTPLQFNLPQNAFTFGLDGYTFLDEKKEYALAAAFAGSYTNGSKEYIRLLQKRPYRYFQRPDATFATFDPEITSLAGLYGRIMLNKQSGNFYLNAALGAVTPGFENNDLGFQFNADKINAHLVLGYRWFEPDGIFRRKQFYLTHARSYDFEGNLLNSMIWLNSNFTLMNYWGFGIRGSYNFESLNKSATRGGPLLIQPSSFQTNMNISSDSREKIIFEAFGGFAKDAADGMYKNLGFDIQWKPNSQLSFSIGPQLELNDNTRMWVGNFTDSKAVNTYGTRYVFSDIHQKTLSANIRLNWTFTPTLTFQLFMQPLLAVGGYNNFKELARSRTNDFNQYGMNGSTISYNPNDGIYNVDPDGFGPAPMFQIGNPDFNYKSLRGTAVLRWEVMPGSILYFVWSHDQSNFDDPGNFSLGRDWRNLLKSDGNNVFVIKFSYWFDI
ncbi:MAG: hypothetical protein CVV24_00230 [Ignavibacteriae bacterium HGW-Ignavibacteriae-3]|nr:MAG: hypothetical protein CVV24_00230 [Ignavibacteriae bacterium HGW-Ignavibacteriae-3]